MDISSLAVRLLFLFLPGILGATIVDILTSHRKRQPFHFILHSYLIGVASYGLLMLIVFISNKIALWQHSHLDWKVTFLKALLNDKKQIHVNEVFYASFLGVIIAFIVVLFINKKWLYNAANRFNLSQKHGDSDVWEFVFNSSTSDWINIRDNDNNLIYQGKVTSYSEKDDKRELLLAQVKVFTADDTTELYEMPFIYFNFDIGSNIVIELN